MRLGIDFGTTRTVVAAADRGNYPVISFQTDSGDAVPWYPSLVAARGGDYVFALDAQSRQHEPGWFFLRSLKRLLAEVGPESPIHLGEQTVPALQLLAAFLDRLRRDLYQRSNLELARHESLEAWIAVPANANSNQRFLTLEGFRRAGFRVLGMINEPSAAGIEYAHRYAAKTGSRRKEYLVVYDLGGGTFDSSIISMKGRSHDVMANEGIARLGGDDFDEQLLELTLSRANGISGISEMARYHLLEECCQQKEGLHSNTRKLAIDLSRAIPDAGEVILPTAEFYQRCAPLVERTISSIEAMVAGWLEDSGLGWNNIVGLYVVGGGSDLPIVARTLRQHYGRRVRRSPYPFAATAIGLAIAAEREAGYTLRERFTRYFGVWREAEGGRRIVFDPIFAKGTPLPTGDGPPLAYTATYHPVHTVGHYRYLECSQLGDDGRPGGDITPWDEIVFPLDPLLRDEPGLENVSVQRVNDIRQQVVQERYVCDARGLIEVTITNQTAGYRRTYRLRQ